MFNGTCYKCPELPEASTCLFPDLENFQSFMFSSLQFNELNMSSLNFIVPPATGIFTKTAWLYYYIVLNTFQYYSPVNALRVAIDMRILKLSCIAPSTVFASDFN